MYLNCWLNWLKYKMNQVCVWDFTLGVEDNFEDLKEALKANCKKWCFQEELSESGFRHYQGRFSLKIKNRLMGVKRLFEDGMHFSITSNENRDNMFYVMKEDTRIAGPWRDEDIEIPSDYHGMVLREWQKQVIETFKVRDMDKINLLYDPQMAGLGKSVLYGYCVVNELAQIIPPLGNAKDISQFVISFGAKPVYLIDIPRASPHLAEMYAGVETVKSGIIYETRYKGKCMVMNRPVIWVFTNTLPNVNWISQRKWKLWIVDYPEGNKIKESNF